MFKIANTINPLFRSRGTFKTVQCGIRQSVEERLGLPEKPKKPMSPFVKFLSLNRQEIQAKNPNAQYKDIFKLGSELWKKSSESTKAALKTEFKQEYQQYSVQLEKYNKSLTDQQKEEIKEAVQDLKEEREKRKERLQSVKRNKDLGKPVKPLSSYLLFSQNEQKNRGSLSLAEFQVMVSNKWKNLSEHEKQKYLDQAKQTQDVYEKELQAWEEKMIKAGNLDVIRQKTLDAALPRKSRKV